MATEKDTTKGLRCTAETWKRFRMAAMADDRSLGDELDALLDLRDQQASHR